MLGPVISENDAKRIEQWVNDAAAKHSGKILCGGKRDGSFYGLFLDQFFAIFKKLIF